MSDNQSIARPYAKAAFEFAKDNESLSSWTSMLALADQVIYELEVQQSLNTLADDRVRLQVLLDVCGDHIDQYFTNYLHVVAENNRLVLLPFISQGFEALLAAYQQTKVVTVIVAEPLEMSQQESLHQVLASKYHCSIELDIHVDPSLLGGMVLKDGETVLDGSIKHAVDTLSSRLQG